MRCSGSQERILDTRGGVDDTPGSLTPALNQARLLECAAVVFPYGHLQV